MRGEPTEAHTFILRVRFQRRDIPDAPATWYGTIEHLPSGESRRVKTLEEISGFIADYLRERV